MALSLNDVIVDIDGRRAVGPVSLQLPRSGITVLFGPSASGKSLLLRTLNRLHEMNGNVRVRGRILLDGTDVMRINVSELRRRVGMVFDVPTPLPLSIGASFGFALRLHGRKTHAAVESAMIEALSRVGLWPVLRGSLKAPNASLPPGLQQELCIARALAIGAEVLILDDPTKTLEPHAVQHLEEILDKLKADFPIILATRHLRQAARCGDQIVLLDQGLVVEAGTITGVLEQSRQPSTLIYLSKQFG